MTGASQNRSNGIVAYFWYLVSPSSYKALQHENFVEIRLIVICNVTVLIVVHVDTCLMLKLS